MYQRWAALCLVLGLCAGLAGKSAGQQDTTQARNQKKGTLGQNYPNPFRAETRLPFSINECTSADHQAFVTLRVYNVLAQVVATPLLEESGKPVLNVALPCGATYVAVWDGRVNNGRRASPSGVYVFQLLVNGKPVDARKGLRRK